MANEQRDNSGVLFKNDRKETEKHADYKGWGVVAGTEVWISAWIKQGKNGKFMSLAITPKEAQREEVKKPEVPKHFRDMDDSIPF